MKKILFSIFLVYFFSFSAKAVNVDFFKGSLTAAKEKAGEEGMLYFVDFVANYCYLCKMMDETTFRDERVVDYVRQHYIPVKVNVDDFDGFVWKQKYNIKVLPTIMVFNSRGEQVGRFEESMGGSRLLSILQEFNIPENRIKISKPNSVPAPIIPPNNSTTATEPSSTPTGKPDQDPVHIPPDNNAQVTPNGVGLFEFSVKRKPAIGFGVQIGVFQDYANVLQEVSKLDASYEVPVLVHITKINGDLAYRVLVGSFATRKLADEFYKNVMQIKGTSGFVKDFATLF